MGLVSEPTHQAILQGLQQGISKLTGDGHLLQFRKVSRLTRLLRPLMKLKPDRCHQFLGSKCPLKRPSAHPGSSPLASQVRPSSATAHTYVSWPSKFKKTGTHFSHFTSFTLKYHSTRSKYTVTNSRSGLKASSLPPTAPAMINL